MVTVGNQQIESAMHNSIPGRNCALYLGVPLGWSSGLGATAVGARSYPCRWELDRGHRPFDARLGATRFLTLRAHGNFVVKNSL